MFNLNTAKAQLISLQLGLQEFGLKPVEWRLIKKNESSFVIQNITADDYYFIGEVRANNTQQWKFIQLAGLY